MSRDVPMGSQTFPDRLKWQNPGGMLNMILQPGDEALTWWVEPPVVFDPALRCRIRAACGAYLTEPWIMVPRWVAFVWDLCKREPWMNVIRVGEREENKRAFLAAMDMLHDDLTSYTAQILTAENYSARSKMRALLKALP